MATSTPSKPKSTRKSREGHGPMSGSLSVPKPIYIDVRNRKEFDAVHIPGSRNIPLSELPQQIEALRRLAQKSRLVFVCRTHNRATRGVDFMHEQGITNCDFLVGGITQWLYKEKPVIRGDSSLSLEGRVRALAGALVVSGVSLAFLVSDWFLLIPAVVGLGLIHAGLTDSCLMGMLLSKLPMNRESSTLLSEQKGGQP